MTGLPVLDLGLTLGSMGIMTGLPVLDLGLTVGSI